MDENNDDTEMQIQPQQESIIQRAMFEGNNSK